MTVERFEPAPGRVSIVGRIEGTDPAAPSLCLMGHTDVVPVNPGRVGEDPFGGEVLDTARARRSGDAAPSTCSTSRRRWP